MSGEKEANEARRELALRLAVELRRSTPARDMTAGHVTRTARAFEDYLRIGKVEQ